MTTISSPIIDRMSIRAQYHIRPSAQGLLAWDVRKLIALAMAQKLKPQPVLLSDIAELDQCYWFSEPSDPPTPRAIAEHMKLVEATDTAYPILLDAEGRLMDGMHRAVQRLLQGHQDILALRLRVTPAPDFVGISADQLPYDDEENASKSTVTTCDISSTCVSEVRL